MKRKVKRYDEGGGVEEMKKGLFAAKEPKMDVEDARFKSAVQANTKLPSAKERTGTSYNTEYKEEEIVKAKPTKKPETSQKFPLREPEYKDTKAKIGNQSFPVEGPKYRGTVKSKDMGSQKFPVEGPKYRGTVSAKELGSQTFSKGGSTASKRADGCAVRGKTRGKIY